MISPTQNLINRCNVVLANGGPESEIENILIEAKGYEKDLVNSMCSYVLDDYTLENIRVLRGWLGKYKEALPFSGSGHHIETVVSPSISVEVNISQTFAELEKSDLSEEELTALKASLADVLAAKEQGPTKFAEKLSKALDLAKSSATAAKAVMDFAAPLMQFLS